MPIEYDILPFLDWLLPTAGERYGALLQFLASFTILATLSLFVWYLFAAIRLGPSEGFYSVAKVVYDAFSRDLPGFSMRRTIAMARLAVQESIRKRVLIAFAVFVVVLLFGGWFLDVKNPNPGRLYLGLVMTLVNYLLLVLALFLSTFSLPTDIKNRTIYTIVTKPVRASEIVLGRVIGFTVVGTAMLVMMCVVSYFFVLRGLAHTHEIAATDMVHSTVDGKDVWKGDATSFDAHHRHKDIVITREADGTFRGETGMEMGHWHAVTATGEGSDLKFIVGPHQGMLRARVPIYGKLRFKDRGGNDADRGVNTGDEWAYRSYIEGKTQATAIWRFQQVTADRFPNGLPLEINMGVFRTHKGNIEQTVLGEIWLENPNKNAKHRRSEVKTFSSREFEPLDMFFDRKVELPNPQNPKQPITIDLFDDLSDRGELEIHIRCAEPAQYFGVAQRDVFLKAADGTFFMNFVKGHVSIWLQMTMATSLGVMFSTFLTGPVAMLGTFASVVLGYFSGFVVKVFDGMFQGTDGLKRFVRDLFGIPEEAGVPGGGPIESFVRMLRQLNPTADLEIGIAQRPAEYLDVSFMLVVRLFVQLLPDFKRFDNSAYVAYGVDVEPNLLGAQIVTALAFVFVTSLIGYFFLKTRELAA